MSMRQVTNASLTTIVSDIWNISILSCSYVFRSMKYPIVVLSLIATWGAQQTGPPTAKPNNLQLRYQV